MMKLLCLTLFTVVCFSFSIVPSVCRVTNAAADQGLKPSSSPFEAALVTLQKQIGYTFEDIGLLRRAMTHSSFSEENNRALSILGSNIIDASVSFQSLRKNIEMSPKDLTRRIAEISKVESSCAVDGTRLGLQKIIRVSSKTDPTNPSIICGALRAIFGAAAIDKGECDGAGALFWKVHVGGDGEVGGAALDL
ncbi:protein NUCLEAR FUSION DEFECTIVE 2 [Punica granatum]|uniref:RNase III domain-containing protein n=2 Tax=Punica granatum TaxID=22663 RepID=A0A218XZW3_PUNGR|nr:protein NUCLEAR FUSION DEFECTIVE 2 [Punica granatum]OWM90484.1 hypothetical protein CDL15_Pgr014787 [Punica granatum]PKI59151.1 hypothetical protein CRG98_020517 [Punica granatum]